MSATNLPEDGASKGAPQEAPYTPNYTLRITFCVLFIFLAEVFLAHYVYRLITAELRSEYLTKKDLHQELLLEMRSEEISRVLRELTPRSKRSADYNALNSSPADEPHVEFFNPELRGSLEAKDELIRQQTGNKGAAPGGDSWIWLTSYSRIPVS